jgi:hypothetical protein
MKNVTTAALILLLTSIGFADGPTRLEIIPTTFDFGWCPDNAKVSAQFILRNISSEMILIMSVQPTCGCTASQFSPATLGSQEETKVGLTFNTRGYANMSFNKTAKVKSDVVTGEFTVTLKGSVVDPNIKVVPVGDGIVGFSPDSKDKKKIIKIENKTDKDVRLDVVQQPVGWAKIKLGNELIAAGKTTDMVVTVDGSYDDSRDTSVTYSASTPEGEVNRFTVAIRTGPAPQPYRQFQQPSHPQVQPTPPAK